MEWTEEELEEAWNNKSEDERLFYGSYEQWKAGIVSENDDENLEEDCGHEAEEDLECE